MNQAGNRTETGFETFEEFVMTVARDMFNDEDLAQIGNGPIPADFVLAQNPTWSNQLGEAKERLVSLKSMKGQDLTAMIRDAHNEEQKIVSLHNEKMKAEKLHAESLLAQLESWLPPTEEHADFKEMLRGKLNLRVEEFSLEFRSPQENISDNEYLKKAIAAQELYVSRLESKVQSERNRVRMINSWLNQLRQSLKSETAKVRSA